ncbi:DUF1542 domain-containing protein, partial [Lacticaseibacillus rhamnosus]|uniref:DUF1542 domain-containing protein n=1 Tax=Lacticaseibacillus rhamnosus TaxID=47715 RepID=UPI0028DFAD41
QAKTAGIKAIDEQHKSGQSIETRKDDAKKAIDGEVAKITDAIDHDPTLTDAEKAAQKQAVIAEADKAKKAIDAAGDADAVDQAQKAGIKAIDQQHNSGQALATRKDAAKKAIDEEAAKVSEAIDHDVTLTDSEKGTQKQAVADEAKIAKQAIDTADNADGVDQAVTKGIQIIDAQHQSGQALTDRKAAAKKAIDAEAAKVGQAIEQDPTLTATEKKRQKQAVADEATKAKAAIDTAANASAVDQAKNAGIKAIDAQHVSGKAFDLSKDEAKKAIDAEATKVQGEIDQDPTLTATVKKQQKEAVTTEAGKAKQAIDQAKNIEEVTTAKDEGIKAIDAQHQSGQAVAT